VGWQGSFLFSNEFSIVYGKEVKSRKGKILSWGALWAIISGDLLHCDEGCLEGGSSFMLLTLRYAIGAPSFSFNISGTKPS
jgi:hypothetical protein